MTLAPAREPVAEVVAKRFAKGGYTLCVGRRNGDKLKTLVDEVESDGGTAVPFTLDARKEERIEEVFRTIRGRGLAPTRAPCLQCLSVRR